MRNMGLMSRRGVMHSSWLNANPVSTLFTDSVHGWRAAYESRRRFFITHGARTLRTTPVALKSVICCIATQVPSDTRALCRSPTLHAETEGVGAVTKGRVTIKTQKPGDRDA